jgi:hypothetical protein
LQLAAISLRGRDDRSTFVAEFAGDDRFVVDYLADEVLDRQPADIRSFLLETSILTRLSAELCAAVTGRSEAGAILQSLERSNMFLVALDDRRHWYRYHHLFADVVRARLAHERADAVPELHRRASAWYEAHADDAEAVAHAMAAGDLFEQLSSSNSPLQNCAGDGRRRRSDNGSKRCPRTGSRIVRCSPSAWSGPHGDRRYHRGRVAARHGGGGARVLDTTDRLRRARVRRSARPRPRIPSSARLARG